MEVEHLVIDTHHQGMRLDKYLSSLFNDYSRTEIRRWIENQRVKVNGKTNKPSYKCQLGDEVVVTIVPPEEQEVTPEHMPLQVVFEDHDVLVINKPRGVTVHPAPGHPSGTLVNGLLAYCHRLSRMESNRPGIVHRLDKDTSGLLVVAKNDEAHDHLSEQFKRQTVTRKYKAIVHGKLHNSQGTIDAPIGRHERDRKKMTVTEKGKQAVTHFKVLELFQNFSYVECELVTGRTHQIRVHLKYIHHPIVGDEKYGPKKTLSIEGHALHAACLHFNHPKTDERLEFTQPIPEDMERMLIQLKQTHT